MTATAEAPKPVKFKTVTLPVKFLGVSFDDSTCSVGIKIDLASINENKEQAVADLWRWLCNRHIKAQLIPGRRDDSEVQGKLIDTDIIITAEFDTNQNGTSHKEVSNRLSVAIDTVNDSDFRKLAKREGKLKILSVMEAIDTGDEDDADANDEERPMIAKGKKAK
jgi:hypothetical protein